MKESKLEITFIDNLEDDQEGCRVEGNNVSSNQMMMAVSAIISFIREDNPELSDEQFLEKVNNFLRAKMETGRFFSTKK